MLSALTIIGQKHPGTAKLNESSLATRKKGVKIDLFQSGQKCSHNIG